MQAMRELYSIQQHAEVGLAATAALLTAHQMAKVVDHSAVMQLTAYLQVKKKGSGKEHAGSNISLVLSLPASNNCHDLGHVLLLMYIIMYSVVGVAACRWRR